MVYTLPASPVPDRFASGPSQRDRKFNPVDHRSRGTRANGGRRDSRHPIVHRVAGRSVALRRVAARRRVARIDPAAIVRRAWRLTGGVIPPQIA